MGSGGDLLVLLVVAYGVDVHFRDLERDLCRERVRGCFFVVDRHGPECEKV